MQSYIERYQTAFIKQRFAKIPVAAILGSRQCGKSTLVKHIIKGFNNPLYLDLENNRDLRMLNDPETFFEDNRNRVICLDEIQRRPGLFGTLRSVVDREKRNGQILLLGSASPDLLKQSSETLAGRISYIELTPFLLVEVGVDNMKDLWLKGGYPRSFLEPDNTANFLWRSDFILAFLERDIPSLERRFQIGNIKRVWQMCAHLTGQVLNYSNLAASLGVSVHTVKSYIEVLVKTYMIRLLPPYFPNVKKRLIKSPKLYIRDTGILHSLLDIEDRNSLLGHPSYGASWETFSIEQILSSLKGWQGYFYRTSSGNEIDLVLVKGLDVIAVECKASSSPELGRGFYIARDNLAPAESWIIAPVKEKYTYDKSRNIHVGNPYHLIARLNKGAEAWLMDQRMKKQ